MNARTVEREVYAALDQIKEGKRAAREGNSRKAWFHMDNAEARLTGLGIYAWRMRRHEAT